MFHDCMITVINGLDYEHYLSKLSNTHTNWELCQV